MALLGPDWLPSTEDAPIELTIKSTSTVYRGAMIARYTNAAGADEGYGDNVGASANMVIAGVAEQNGGTCPAGRTLTFAAGVRALQIIKRLNFSGGLTTAKRGAMVYGVDENTGSLTPGAGIPVGMVIEVISATVAKVGIGPDFVARAGASAAATMGAANAFQVDEWLAPAATSTTALLTATAITATPQTVSSFVSGGVTALAAFPRNVTFTGGGTTADCPTSAAVTGTDIDGNALTETVALTAGSGTGAKAFKTVTSVVFTGSTSTDSTVAVGIGSVFGLSKTIKSRAHRLAVIQEVYAASTTGSVVTNGTYVDATTSPPHGTYAGNSAPDGTKSYALTYEHS